MPKFSNGKKDANTGEMRRSVRAREKYKKVLDNEGQRKGAAASGAFSSNLVKFSEDKAKGAKGRKKAIPSVAISVSEYASHQAKLNGDKCPMCNEPLKYVEDSAGCRFHLSIHYYDQNKFSTKGILTPSDPDADGKAVDDKGKVVKYTCKHAGCTRRKMGYKEMCVHLATQHQELRQLLRSDDNQDMKKLGFLLYEDEMDENPVKLTVKKENVDINLSEESENSEDVDNPDDTSTFPPSANVVTETLVPLPVRREPRSRASQVPAVAVSGVVKAASSSTSTAIVRVDKLINCPLCKDKEGKNLASSTDLKYHISVCAYSTGGFIKFLDPKQGTDKNKRLDEQLLELEEFGKLYKYKCPFENCDKNMGHRNKLIGYKEFAIHSAVVHGVLERWAKEEANCRELYELLRSVREEEGGKLPEVPDIIVEECHICLLCNGGDDKEGFNLGFQREKLYSTRYHYAACLYGTGCYFPRYPPGKHNTREDGAPRDTLGREMKYSCQERGCSMKRKMGYKEFAIHMANDHGGLEEILGNHEDVRLREVVPKLRLQK